MSTPNSKPTEKGIHDMVARSQHLQHDNRNSTDNCTSNHHRRLSLQRTTTGNSSGHGESRSGGSSNVTDILVMNTFDRADVTSNLALDGARNARTIPGFPSDVAIHVSILRKEDSRGNRCSSQDCCICLELFRRVEPG